MKDLETYDIKYHNLKHIHNMIYLKIYEAIDSQKFMAIRRETSKIYSINKVLWSMKKHDKTIVALL